MNKNYIPLFIVGTSILISAILIPFFFDLSFNLSYQNLHPYQDTFNDLLDTIETDNLQDPNNENLLNNSRAKILINYYHKIYDPKYNMLISTDPETSRQCVMVLHNFRYIYYLLETNNNENIVKANKMLIRISKVDVAKYGSIFVQTYFSGYNGYGGFYDKYFLRTWSTFKYTDFNMNFSLKIVPYYIDILERFNHIINVSILRDLKANLPVMADQIIRLKIEPENIVKFLDKIAALYMITEQIRSVSLEGYANDYLIQAAEYLINSKDIQLNNSELIDLIPSLISILKYCPSKLLPVLFSIYESITSKINITGYSLDKISESNPDLNKFYEDLDSIWLFNRTYDKLFKIINILSGPELSPDQILQFRFSIKIDHKPILQNLLLYSAISAGLIMLNLGKTLKPKYIFNPIFKESLKIFRKLNKTNFHEPLYHPINFYIERISAYTLPVIYLLVPIFWHYNMGLYLFLFIWPVTFLYGIGTNEDNAINYTFGYFSIMGIVIFSVLSNSAISIIQIFVIIWILEFFASIFLAYKLFNGIPLSHGFQKKSMGYILLFTAITEGIYVLNFIFNRYLIITPNLLTIGIFLKGFTLMRTKFG